MQGQRVEIGCALRIAERSRERVDVEIAESEIERDVVGLLRLAFGQRQRAGEIRLLQLALGGVERPVIAVAHQDAGDCQRQVGLGLAAHRGDEVIEGAGLDRQLAARAFEIQRLLQRAVEGDVGVRSGEREARAEGHVVVAQHGVGLGRGIEPRRNIVVGAFGQQLHRRLLARRRDRDAVEPDAEHVAAARAIGDEAALADEIDQGRKLRAVLRHQAKPARTRAAAELPVPDAGRIALQHHRHIRHAQLPIVQHAMQQRTDLELRGELSDAHHVGLAAPGRIGDREVGEIDAQRVGPAHLEAAEADGPAQRLARLALHQRLQVGLRQIERSGTHSQQQ